MTSSTRYSSRGSPEDEAEIVLASIASGLVRMSDWNGVAEQQRPYDGNLQHGLDRLAIACLRASVPAPVGVGDLVWKWCATKPLGEWPLTFPADADVDDELLLIDGRPSEFCEEWALSVPDVAAEIHESKLVHNVKEVADDLDRPELYAEWRATLSELPVVTAEELLRLKNRHPDVTPWAEWFDDAYEPVPQEATRAGMAGICGGCMQWTSPVGDANWRCRSWRCQYSGNAPTPKLVAAAGARRLRAEFVDSIALPAIPELRLARKLTKRGADVVLYPALDAVDLFARRPDGRTVAIDVKDWRSPYLLARHLRWFPRWPQDHRYAYDESFIVVPNDRVKRNRAYTRLVRKHSSVVRAPDGPTLCSESALIRKTPKHAPEGAITYGP